MMEIRARETVILASDFEALVAWYRDALGFLELRRFDDGFHWCLMEASTGLRIGIGAAAEMGVAPTDRAQNPVALQVEVDDVPAFLAHVERHGGVVRDGPHHNEKDGYWFGAFADPEGNPVWVVDKNCP